jgi:protein tyrosine phosphatase (PTP) superfamily phosphohydrolase (DUF442 family)
VRLSADSVSVELSLKLKKVNAAAAEAGTLYMHQAVLLVGFSREQVATFRGMMDDMEVRPLQTRGGRRRSRTFRVEFRFHRRLPRTAPCRQTSCQSYQ